jgi:hypothetical protein
MVSTSFPAAAMSSRRQYSARRTILGARPSSMGDALSNSYGPSGPRDSPTKVPSEYHAYSSASPRCPSRNARQLAQPSGPASEDPLVGSRAGIAGVLNCAPHLTGLAWRLSQHERTAPLGPIGAHWRSHQTLAADPRGARPWRHCLLTWVPSTRCVDKGSAPLTRGPSRAYALSADAPVE